MSKDAILTTDYVKRCVEGGVPIEEIKIPGWDCSVARRNGKPCALVITRGTEIHFQSVGGAAMTRKNTLEYLKPIFDEWGFVTTRTFVGETDHKLRNVLGFKYQWTDGQFDYWTLFALPFAKKANP